MKVYQTKSHKLAGTNYSEIYPKAFALFKHIRQKGKRRAYIRSAYFNKQKVFLDLFWPHLHDKNWSDKVRRLKFYACALELIQNSKYEPFSIPHPGKRSEILHRFTGMSAEKDLFYVQIKEDKKTNEKFLISVFPGSSI